MKKLGATLPTAARNWLKVAETLLRLTSTEYEKNLSSSKASRRNGRAVVLVLSKNNT